MTQEFTTAGERMCQRKLYTKDRAGIPHYVGGQHHAVIVEEDEQIHAVLSYINLAGTAVKVLCRKRPDGEWVPRALQIAGVEFTGTPQPISLSFLLSSLMIEALDEADKRWCEEQGLGN